MFTPNPRAAAPRRLSALTLLSLLLNLLPAPPAVRAAAAPVQAGAASFVRVLNLPTNDLVYDRQTQKIFASVPSSAGSAGNSVTEVDPAAGSVGPSVFVGSEPNKLALADDGHTLYVGLDGASSVRRFDTTTQTAGSQFYLGNAPSNPISDGPYTAAGLAAMPGSPGTVAVSRIAGDFNFSTSLSIYDEGVKRPEDSDGAGRQVEFSSSPDRIYTTDGGSARSSGVTRSAPRASRSRARSAAAGAALSST
jgi:hypothetical protein